MNNIDVYVQAQNSGLLAKTPRAGDYNDRHSFTYQTGAKQAVSLAMPLRAESYEYSGLHPIFQMNLPEGYLRDYLERAVAKKFGSDDLTVLTLLGNNQIGRLQYRIAGEAMLNDGIDTPKLSDILGSRDQSLFNQLLTQFALRSGVAGVQPKILLDAVDLKIDSKSTLNIHSYVVKTWGEEFPQLACNEYVCMTLCKNAGLRVADFYLSDNAKLFVSKRFDIDSFGNPLGFEDFCVLQGKSTKQKYDASLESCINTMTQFISPEYLAQARSDFFKLTVINVLIKNGDAHLKNSGVIYQDLSDYQQGHLPKHERKLAPIFDVVSTVPYIKNDSMALTLTGSKRWPKWKVLEKFAISHCGLTKKKAGVILEEVYRAAQETLPILRALKEKHEGFAAIANDMEGLLISKL